VNFSAQKRAVIFAAPPSVLSPETTELNFLA